MQRRWGVAETISGPLELRTRLRKTMSSVWFDVAFLINGSNAVD